MNGTLESRRAAKIPAVIAIGLAAGFLLCGYEFIRSPSTSLFIAAYGAGRLPYTMFAGAVYTLLVLGVYDRALSRFGPRRTLLILCLFSALVIALSYWLWNRGLKPAAVLIYAFREAYIVVIVEQYWSFINSTLAEKQAKRWNGLICGLGSLGAISGGYAIRFLARPGSPLYIGTEAILLLSALSLLPAAALSDLAYRLGGEPAPSRQDPDSTTHRMGLNLLAQSSYLRRIALLIVLTQVVSTVLDLSFSTLLESALPDKDARTAYLGSFYAVLNCTASGLQFAVTPLLLAVLPLKLIMPLIPLVHLGAAAALLVHPTLLSGSAAYLLFKALDYSVFRAGKEIFYIPLPFDARYRAKQLIDAFGYRAAKGGAAALVSLGRLACDAIPLAAYPLTAIACVVAWAVTTVRLVSRHGQLRQAAPLAGSAAGQAQS
jgi:AAA family ATP:ADP antiporter